MAGIPRLPDALPAADADIHPSVTMHEYTEVTTI
jgi:hypothetical protein